MKGNVMTAQRPQLLKATEVAERLQMSKSNVYALMKSGELPNVRIGGSVRVPAEALDRYLAELSGGAAPAAAGRASVRRSGDAHASAQAFREETSMTPAAFVDAWRDRALEDTSENTELVVRALAIRQALAGAPVPVP